LLKTLGVGGAKTGLAAALQNLVLKKSSPNGMQEPGTPTGGRNQIRGMTFQRTKTVVSKGPSMEEIKENAEEHGMYAEYRKQKKETAESDIDGSSVESKIKDN
jgi:hypothetical protein